MVKFTNPPETGTSEASSVRAPQFLQCAVHQEMVQLGRVAFYVVDTHFYVKYLNLCARVLWLTVSF